MDGNLTAGPTGSQAGAPPGPPPSPPGPPPSLAGLLPSPPGSGRRLPRREARGLRLLGIPVWQVVAVEAVLGATALTAAAEDRGGLAAGAGVAVVGLVLVLARRAHRPLLAWVPVWLARRGRRHARRHGAALTHAGDPRLAPLREVLPALTVDGIALRAGQRLAVCFDGTGWSAVLRARPDGPRLPMGVLAQALRIDDIPLAAVQVLVHTVPAPDGRLPEDTPAVVSYRQLGGPHVPAVRETFVVLRLDPRDAGDAIEARGGGPDGARRALKRCVSHVRHLLEAEGVATDPLAGTLWLEAVRDVGGLPPVSGPVPPPSPGDPAPDLAGVLAPGPRSGLWTHEDRRYWRLGDLTHVTWWVRGFPDTPAPLHALVEAACPVAAASAQVSFTLHPGPPGTVRCRALVRTAGRSPELAEAAAAELRDRAAALGIALQRLDGEQGPGYLSTLPLGGGTL